MVRGRGAIGWAGATFSLFWRLYYQRQEGNKEARMKKCMMKSERTAGRVATGSAHFRIFLAYYVITGNNRGQKGTL
jgi:hypothetical protein